MQVPHQRHDDERVGPDLQEAGERPVAAQGREGEERRNRGQHDPQHRGPGPSDQDPHRGTGREAQDAEGDQKDSTAEAMRTTDATTARGPGGSVRTTPGRADSDIGPQWTTGPGPGASDFSDFESGVCQGRGAGAVPLVGKPGHDLEQEVA